MRRCECVKMRRYGYVGGGECGGYIIVVNWLVFNIEK
jgi:hypothetical protein